MIISVGKATIVQLAYDIFDSNLTSADNITVRRVAVKIGEN